MGHYCKNHQLFATRSKDLLYIEYLVDWKNGELFLNVKM